MARKPTSVVIRREWLRLYEEEGKTAPEIAKAYDNDPRTVRKGLELARQDREEREASVLVLREAKEKHYGDLVAYAENIDKEIQRASLPSPFDRLFIALREHLPRSPLWKRFNKLENLNEIIRNKETSLREIALKLVQEESRKTFSKEPIETGLDIEGTAGALVHHLEQPVGPFVPEIEERKVKEGLREIKYGPWNCGVVPDNQVADIKGFIEKMISTLSSPPNAEEFEELHDKLEERNMVIEGIREELASIIMKRIVSGRCKYCPF